MGDGNSGQGDDKKHNCEFEGCDDQLCCDEDVLPPDDGDDPDPSDDGNDPDPSDDGDDPDPSDDGSNPDPSDDNDDPSPDGETPDPDSAPTCEQTCNVDADCGSSETVCVEGCCSVDIQ